MISKSHLLRNVYGVLRSTMVLWKIVYDVVKY